MSLSSSSLLAKLDELKKWQQNQQERLLKQHQARLEETNKEYSEYDTIKGLSAFDSFQTDKPEETPKPQVQGNLERKPKKPFLRKGAGLVRFGMKSGDQKRPSNKMKPPKISPRKPVITPLKVPEVNIMPNVKWKDVCKEEEKGVQIKQQVINNFQANPQVFEAECPTRQEFIETDSNFVHDDSFGAKTEFLECFKQLAKEKFGPQTNNLEETNGSERLDFQPETPINQKPTGAQHLNVINEEFLSYLQQLAAKSEISISSKASDMSAYEKALEKELQVFEQLERKVMNSSFCSTSSSVLQLLSSTPHQIPGVAPLLTDNKKVHFEEKPCKKALSFQYETTAIVNEEASQEDETKVWQENSDDDGESSDSTVSNCVNVIVKQNAATMTDDQGGPSEFDEECLRRKAEELNAEIETFRTENKKLIKLKSDVELQQKEMQKSRKKLEAELLEERIRLEYEMDEQKKKFNKEKMVFEKYVKDLQNKPNRKEREEISTLKCELESVKETLKLKETRNGTTQARLRNQIKALEKENVGLKDEVEKLQKQNAKLVASQKVSGRKNSETKMLHEINKNLTRLTKEKKGASLDESLEGWTEKKKVRNRRKSEGYETEYQKSFGRKGEDENWGHRKKNFGEKRMVWSSKERQERRSDETEEESEEDWGKIEGKKDSLVDEKRLSKDSLSKCLMEENQKALSEEKRSSKGSLSKLRNLSESEDTRNLSEKENDRNSTNCDITSFRNLSEASNFDNVFTKTQAKNRNLTLNDTQASTVGKVESFLEDGTKETKYPNGNVKRTSPDGNFVKIRYFNGDLKETNLLDGSIKYFYAENQIWQTTLIDGNEILQYPDGQIEKNFSDGRIVITFPNGIVKETDSEGLEKIIYPDGSVVTVNSDNEKVLLLPNGQKEIHTKDHKRREYPDGTVKILYPDGLQETRYSNGRIRMKDKDGNLLMDSHGEV